MIGISKLIRWLFLSATLQEIQLFKMNLRVLQMFGKIGITSVVKLTFYYVYRLNKR